MKNPVKTAPLLNGETYHVYNRAVGDELLFKTENDYFYFLKKFERFVDPFIEMYSYCLLPNHFHFLLKVINEDGVEKSFDINRAFSNFFISYVRSFNNSHKRMGKLFCQPFKRIAVEEDNYFVVLVNYIHRNPIHHGYVNNHCDWKYSSFNAFITNKTTKINRDEVLGYFHSIDDFREFHNENKYRNRDEKYFLE